MKKKQVEFDRATIAEFQSLYQGPSPCVITISFNACHYISIQLLFHFIARHKLQASGKKKEGIL